LKFRFRLEKVLSHKKVEKDLAQRDYIEAQNRYNSGVNLLHSMHSEISDAKKFESDVILKGGQTAESLKWSTFFIQGQEIKIEIQKKANRQLIQDVERKQEILVERAREFKTFERLREKMKERFKKQVKKQDVKSIDEIVVMSANRRQVE
jgi:flagellar protein FliJ